MQNVLEVKFIVVHFDLFTTLSRFLKFVFRYKLLLYLVQTFCSKDSALGLTVLVSEQQADCSILVDYNSQYLSCF